MSRAVSRNITIKAAALIEKNPFWFRFFGSFVIFGFEKKCRTQNRRSPKLPKKTSCCWYYLPSPPIQLTCGVVQHPQLRPPKTPVPPLSCLVVAPARLAPPTQPTITNSRLVCVHARRRVTRPFCFCGHLLSHKRVHLHRSLIARK